MRQNSICFYDEDGLNFMKLHHFITSSLHHFIMKYTRKTMHLYASPRIFGNAKNLRRNLTPTEELLWTYLRNRQIENVKFRKQHPMSRYVADFYAHEVKMVIELDGKHHENPDQLFYDMDRTEVLAFYGISILRFKNEQVLHSIKEILEEIKNEIVRIRSAKKKK